MALEVVDRDERFSGGKRDRLERRTDRQERRRGDQQWRDAQDGEPGSPVVREPVFRMDR